METKSVDGMDIERRLKTIARRFGVAEASVHSDAGWIQDRFSAQQRADLASLLDDAMGETKNEPPDSN